MTKRPPTYPFYDPIVPKSSSSSTALYYGSVPRHTVIVDDSSVPQDLVSIKQGSKHTRAVQFRMIGAVISVSIAFMFYV